MRPHGNRIGDDCLGCRRTLKGIYDNFSANYQGNEHDSINERNAKASGLDLIRQAEGRHRENGSAGKRKSLKWSGRRSNKRRAHSRKRVPSISTIHHQKGGTHQKECVTYPCPDLWKIDPNDPFICCG